MLWTIQQTQIDVRFTKIQQTFWKMNALRRQNIRPQQTFERWTPRTQESPRELARQSEAKRKQAPQSEANVCRRRKCNLKKTSLINCTGHPLMHKTPKQLRGCVLVSRTQLLFFIFHVFFLFFFLFYYFSCFKILTWSRRNIPVTFTRDSGCLSTWWVSGY